MAIKLMGVEDSPSTTQDFVMINNPVFFVRNAADYVDLATEASPVKFFFSLNPFHLRLHELFVALTITRHKTRNPLDLRYFSTTPYRCGAIAAKFSARPAGGPSPFTAADGPDFLHDNLASHLAADALGGRRRRTGNNAL